MLKQVFLINKDLKMGIGKVAVQAAHGEVIYMKMVIGLSADAYMEERYIEWRAETLEDPIGMMKKVVLKSSESEMRDYITRLKLQGVWYFAIFDKGLTQIPENSLTCIVVEPLKESKCDELFGDLKLL